MLIRRGHFQIDKVVDSPDLRRFDVTTVTDGFTFVDVAGSIYSGCGDKLTENTLGRIWRAIGAQLKVVGDVERSICWSGYIVANLNLDCAPKMRSLWESNPERR